MLFDLRGRGRRRTVQGVYLVLALILGGGLVLFGVGTGNGNGGLLNAFNGGGSGNGKPVATAQEKAALRQTQLQPSNPAAWKALVEARYEAAGQSSNPNTNTYTPAGLTKLRQAGQAWQRYVQLTKKPDWTLAELAANAYEQVGNAKAAVGAWQIVTQANPSAFTYFERLAADAWAAKETDLGDLASQRAITLAPATQKAQIKLQLQQLKTQVASSAATSTTATGR